MEKLKVRKAVNQKQNFKNSNAVDADHFHNESVVSVAPTEQMKYILRLVTNFQNIFDQPITIFCSEKSLAFQFLLEYVLFFRFKESAYFTP